MTRHANPSAGRQESKMRVKRRSSSKLKKMPAWSIAALQGVCYWMGHRRSLYRHYPLAEGAVVAEICNLISANLPDSRELTCEVQYSKLSGLPEAPKVEGKEEITLERTRADLVVSEGSLDDGAAPEYVIEVKRYSAGKREIEADLRRLAEIRHRYPKTRAFLFVISEGKRPNRFLNDKGNSLKGKLRIPDSKDHFRVRRTLKAAHAYTRWENAQYACLLEVYVRRTKSVGQS
jgi:hypothetical protein